jgi:excisionase family DNA binding protein
MHPDVLTTGQIASICRISQQSVIRMAESGGLKFYRVPGSTHRRFMVNDVRSFMTRHEIPIEWLEEYLKAHRPPTESS